MNKTKTVAIIGGIVGLLVVGGGILVWHQHSHKLASQFDPGKSSINEAGSAAASDDSSTLNVAQNSGSTSSDQLGQLSTKSGSGDSSSGSLGVGGSGSGDSSGSTGASLPDPSTFGQYDKYKDGTSALFSEIQKGTGDELTQGKKAAVYYKGWLTNGQLFDESKAGSDGKVQPFVYELGAHQVIPGWEQGMSGMKVGGVRLLIIPPSVGYGAAGQASIPPNSVLVFAVQLVAVQ